MPVDGLVGCDLQERHGTAVAEVVHEMAPDAQIYLLCGGTYALFRAAVDRVIAAGIPIFNASLGWKNSSRGDGSGADGTPDFAVEKARQAGVLPVISAGNDAEKHWSGTDANGTPARGFVEFAPGDETLDLQVRPNETLCVSLKWDAWTAPVDDDYDLFLFDAGLATRLEPAQGANAQSGGAGQTPTEQVCHRNGAAAATVRVAIFRFDADVDPRFDLFISRGRFPEVIDERETTAGSMLEPASSPAALSVAAICWQTDVAGAVQLARAHDRRPRRARPQRPVGDVVAHLRPLLELRLRPDQRLQRHLGRGAARGRRGRAREAGHPAGGPGRAPGHARAARHRPRRAGARLDLRRGTADARRAAALHPESEPQPQSEPEPLPAGFARDRRHAAAAGPAARPRPTGGAGGADPADADRAGQAVPAAARLRRLVAGRRDRRDVRRAGAARLLHRPARAVPRLAHGHAATSGTFTGRAGTTYCFRARSTAASGAVSDWSAPACTAIPVDDGALDAFGAWQGLARHDRFMNTVTQATRRGASLALTEVRATRLALVVTRCPRCGSVDVYFRGRRLEERLAGRPGPPLPGRWSRWAASRPSSSAPCASS